MRKTIIGMFYALALFGQPSQSEENSLVTVPRRYVSAEGLAHQETGVASKWVGIGREIGIATKEGLTSVVDVSEKFGSTNVGHFVMFMVAWKIIGKDAIGILIGIPFSLLTLSVWIWSLKRFFFGYRVLYKEDPATKIKEYRQAKYEFQAGDGRAACCAIHVIAIGVWLIGSAMVIF